MHKFIVSQATTNRLIAYSSICMIVVQTILSYFVDSSVIGTIRVFGLALAMFGLPLIIYFIRPSSAVFKYLFVLFRNNFV